VGALPGAHSTAAVVFLEPRWLSVASGISVSQPAFFAFFGAQTLSIIASSEIETSTRHFCSRPEYAARSFFIGGFLSTNKPLLAEPKFRGILPKSEMRRFHFPEVLFATQYPE
jgi:hypothetical protein